MRTVRTTVEAPTDLGIAVIGVPTGSPVDLDLRLESVVEGVLVTGTAVVQLSGECVRCLVGISDELEVDVQELFTYSESDAGEERGVAAAGRADRPGAGSPRPGGARAAVPTGVLTGLCRVCVSMCGTNLNDHPEHSAQRRHRPPLGEARRPGGVRHEPRTAKDEQHRRQPELRKEGRTDGRSEEADVAEQHPAPPVGVEGDRAGPGGLHQPGLPGEAPAAHRVSVLRPVRSAQRSPTGPRVLTDRSSGPDGPAPGGGVARPARDEGEPRAVRACADPPLVRLRARWPADQRAAWSSSATPFSVWSSPSISFGPTRSTPRASWPSCAPRS